MTHLQKITTLAKKIRKGKPSMKWTDAIKQASKQIKPAAKKAAVKKRAIKKVSGVKKSAPKKPAVKTHKDTKSHNVNIRVVSGVNEKINQLKIYQDLLSKEKKYLDSIEYWKKALKDPKNQANAKQLLALSKTLLKSVRQQKAIQKRLI